MVACNFFNIVLRSCLAFKISAFINRNLEGLGKVRYMYRLVFGLSDGDVFVVLDSSSADGFFFVGVVGAASKEQLG